MLINQEFTIHKKNRLFIKCCIPNSKNYLFIFNGSLSSQHFGGVSKKVFFSWKKKLIVLFFGVKFDRDLTDYHVAIIPILHRDRSQKLEKPNFFEF